MEPKDGRVISNFIVQSLQGLPLTVYGKGLQTRSFCYIDDLITGLILLMHSGFEKPINLGNPEEFKITELASRILEITNSDSQIVYEQLPQDDPKQRCPDIALAKKTLSWSPKIKLDEGLKPTVKWFDKCLKDNNRGL
tara:strand:- start:934 stop:1347 length:414 start_codon:yes stop_codon:yes gene_type:complete